MKSNLAKFILLGCILGIIWAEDTYVIEAKGEFGKELSELVKKHAEDQNMSVNTYQKDENSSNLDINTSNLDQNTAQNEELYKKGEKLYASNCKSCHGEMGTKKALNVSKRLSDMSGEDIKMAVESYFGDDEYGGRLKRTMQLYAAKINGEQLKAIIYYLKKEDK